MISDYFALRIIRNKPLPIDQLIRALKCGRVRVCQKELVDFIVAQQALIAEEKRKLKEAKQNENNADCK